MPLTNDQQAAADAFYKFLFRDDQTFILSGGAGVGKTYMMKYLKDVVMPKYTDACKLTGLTPEFHDSVFTATTNKAAEVLEKAINSHVQTVHSYLGIQVKNDNKSKQQVLIQNKVKNTAGLVLFVDEASMIDSQLYDIILQNSKNAKLVFVGDHAQMAPVSERLSPIYKDVKEANFIFLNEVVRNAHSPALMALCSQLRTTVETGEFFPIDEVPGSIEYLDDQAMQAELTHYFRNPNPTCRILTYTNERAKMYNSFIRELRNLPETFVPGEIVVNAKAYFSSTDKTFVSVERELEILEVKLDQPAGWAQYTPNRAELIVHEYKVKRLDSSATFIMRVPADPDMYQMILKATAKQKNWSDYHHLKQSYGDLRDPEACTIYKSQGSTYDTVFIDIGNIGVSRDPEQVARMLFVGASRAQNKVFFYGSLPVQYQGKKSA